jgi:formylglycine-generating enzyme required for sulfatase activity
MGGVAGALSRHGDSVLSGMDGTQRASVRRVLLRLVTALGTRVRRTVAEVSTSDESRAALDALVDGRLLVVHQGDDGTTYELAHEILVHGWGTLREWLDDDAGARERGERLSVAAAEWSTQRRRADLTWRGPRLTAARALDPAQLTSLELEFIAASSRAALRRMWFQRSAFAGIIVMLIGTYAVQRQFARSRIASAVAVELAAARGFLEQARTADHAQRELASAAFLRFDSGQTVAAEASWRVVVAERVAAEGAFRMAGRSLEAALAKDPTRTDNRALMGDILYERAVLAEAVHDLDQRDELIGRLASYDTDGIRRARWTSGGTLVIHTAADATVKIGSNPWVRSTGEIRSSVSAGSQTIEVRADGREPVRDVVLVDRSGTTEVTIALPPTGSVPPGFVYIPVGTFLAGSTADEDSRISFFQTVPLHRRTTGAFLIARTEVTIADWIEFVTAQPAPEQAALLPRINAQTTGAMIVARDFATWRITLQPMAQRFTALWGEPLEYTGRASHPRQDWRRFPITGISGKDAERYAAWLDQTGRVRGARLCHELEWARAARGADGRNYPQGDRFEPGMANVDITHGRDRMGPDEVGSYPQSTSPYGLLDTSGNAFEWTHGEYDEYVVRGGSYYHDRKTANLANRSVVPGDLHDAALGVRVCATAPAVPAAQLPQP